MNFIVPPCNNTLKIPKIFIFSDGNYENLRYFSNDTLVFKSVQKNNEGKYSCEADNGVGVPIKKTMTLIVHGNIKKKYKFKFYNKFIA